jgi:hypothetical protein
VPIIFGFWNYFLMGKGCGLGPWVGGPCRGGRSMDSTVADGRGSPELGLTAALGRGGLS